jgi:hypothetical protein
MPKKIIIFLILTVFLGGALSPLFSEVAYAQACRTDNGEAGLLISTGSPSGNPICVASAPGQTQAQAQTQHDKAAASQSALYEFGGPFVWAFKQILGIMGEILLRIGALILSLAGLLFDLVLNYTIVDMAKNLSAANGVGGGINAAWSTLRDVGNIVFIFVLLWASIQTILQIGGDLNKTIRNIIIIGLLVNFSLFATKVVIDASNIASIGFYNSIITSAGAAPVKLFGEEMGSISSIVMRFTGMQSFYSGNVLNDVKGFGDNNGTFIVGILGAIFMFVVAIIFLVAAVLFIVRYILLLFLLILSPIAFIAFILPAFKSYFTQWWNALTSQAFFAPVFFLLLWVAIKMMASMPVLGLNATFAEIASEPQKIMGILLNFTLITGLFVAALVLSKQIAVKTPGFNKLSALAGGATIGTAGFLGRHTVGRGARAALNSGRLRNMTASKNFAARTFAKSALWTSKKGAGASYDARGLADTGLGKATGLGGLTGSIGKAGGKGGFAKAVDEKATAKEKYAKEVYGQTSGEKERLENAQNEEKTRVRADRQAAARTAEAEAANAERERKQHLDNATRENRTVYDSIKRERNEKQAQINRERERNGDSVEARRLQQELDAITARMVNEREVMKEAQQEVESTDQYQRLKIVADEKNQAKQEAQKKVKKKEIDDEEYTEATQNLKKAPRERQEAYAGRLSGGLLGKLGGNKEAARKVREQAKGKSAKDKLADAAKQLQQEEGRAEEAAPTGTPAGGTPAAGGAPPTGGGGTQTP